MSFNTLNDIIRMARAKFPSVSKRLSEAEALARWDAVVGPAIAKHSHAVRVLDGVLWVEVDHPIWMSELHHRKRQILDLLNKPKAGETEAAAAQSPAPPNRGPKPKGGKGLKQGFGTLPSKDGRKIAPTAKAPEAPPPPLVDIRFVDRKPVRE